jgi:hypothetical protein
MRTPRTLLTLMCVALSATALSQATSPASAAARGPALRGVQLVDVDGATSLPAVDAQLDGARRTGANMVRLYGQWGDLEAERPGQMAPGYLRLIDHTMQGAARRGMKVALTLGFTPCWASSAPPAVRGTCSTRAERDGAGRYPPADPADFARFAGFAAKRWGSFLAGLEVYNEPDQSNELYFAGPDKVARYAALLKAAYPAIKRADPRVPVLGGAFVGKDGRFLKALYAAGAKGSYDLLSVHFYDLVLDALKNVRAVQRANGDRTPLWLGEFGWTSCFPRQVTQGGHVCVTPAVQGANLLDTMQALQTISYVRGAMIFSVRDTPEFSFGAFDRLLRPKPAVAALRRGFSRRPGRPRAIRLHLARRGGAVVASGSGPAGGAYQIDVAQGGTLRYQVALRLDRDNHFRVVLPAALGTRGLRVTMFQQFLRRPVTRRI